jgi:hypothetical protein
LDRTIVKYQEIAMECFEYIIVEIPTRVRTLNCSTIKVPCCCSGTQGVPLWRGGGYFQRLIKPLDSFMKLYRVSLMHDVANASRALVSSCIPYIQAVAHNLIGVSV